MTTSLEQVEYQEYEYPHQVHEVPIEANFLYHFVAIFARYIYPTQYVECNDAQEYYPGENVETVETRDEEEQSPECFGSELLHASLAFVRAVGVYILVVDEALVVEYIPWLVSLFVIVVLAMTFAVPSCMPWAVHVDQVALAFTKRLTFFAFVIQHVPISGVSAEYVAGERHVLGFDQVGPLPSLAAQEAQAANDGQKHPNEYATLVFAVAFLYRSHHRYRADDQQKGHEGNEDQRCLAKGSGEAKRVGGKNEIRDWPSRAAETQSAISDQETRKCKSI